ncbi:MAG: phenylalanine--tRNA ligase subunit beta [Candidatus Omnitrophota bacterium]|nr:phenylalanine--tRNA ligase subunit beta [Candidatus Omnitrophota bacterium]
MRVTYNWLKDFVEIKLPARELADKLTMAGLEVVSLEEKEGDFIFEIEITSNRPDWLSVLGIAREVAAITGAKLKLGAAKEPKSLNPKTKNLGPKINIENKNDCSLYTARIIKNVKVGPSPEWMRQRLELIGCRSVNNLVDITNYVLFELGEPLHAFDLDKLDPEKIVVRRAKPGEKLATIDAQERNLASNVLVIADQHKVVALAGVMGGKETEVNEKTKNVLLEAAVFNPLIVRRSRQALALQSESSYRFERGVDLEMVRKTSARALELIKEYCGGEEVTFGLSGLTKVKEAKVALDASYVAKILGINLAPIKIKQMLTRLGFKIQLKSKSIFNVGVPSFRQDVKQQVDLIEEVARIFGYARIPVSLPSIRPDLTPEKRRGLVSEIKNMLIGLGVNEAITYSLIDRRGLNSLGFLVNAKPVEIMNPLSQEQEVLRPTLILGLARAAAFNLNQKQDYVALFEIAHLFRLEEKPAEELALAIALSGTKSFLTEQGLVRDEASLLNLKGVVETIFNRLGIIDYDFINRGASGIDVYAHNEKIGVMLGLSPQTLKELDVKNRDLFLLEVSLDKLFSFAKLNKRFIPLPKYPGILRDISFILKEELSVKDILALLKEKGQPLLRNVLVADYYKGKQIPAGYRGLTLSCLYASSERTLTEKEIQPLHDALCETLSQKFEVKIR